MNRVAGKVALITGATRGTGAAHAGLLTAEGARAVLADVLDTDGEALAVELGHAARFVHLDVTQESDWANALRLTLAEFGHLDVLVNTAGIANGSPIGDFPLALRQKTVEINLTGSFLGMKTVSRVLTSQGTVPSSTCPPSMDGGAVLGPGARVQLDDFECRPVDRRAHSLPCLPQRPTVDRAAAVAGATDLVHGPDAFLQRAGCGLTAQCGAAPGAA